MLSFRADQRAQHINIIISIKKGCCKRNLKAERVSRRSSCINGAKPKFLVEEANNQTLLALSNLKATQAREGGAEKASSCSTVAAVETGAERLTCRTVATCRDRRRSRLRAVDEHLEQATATKDSGKLLLIEEEWAARRNSGKVASSSRGGDDKCRGKAFLEKKKQVDLNACRRCGKIGHWTRECLNRKQEKKAEAHLAQPDDDEATILMATFCALYDIEVEEKEEATTVEGPGKALKARGNEVLIKDGVLRIRDREQRLLAKVKRSLNWLYLLDLKVEQPVCLAARHTEDPWLWHARFEHLSFDALSRLEKMVRGLPHIKHGGELCDSCLVRKQRRLPFPKAAKYRAKDALKLVHDDLCGPITPATNSGRWYFLLQVDDCSCYMWLQLLTSKDEAAAAIKKFKMCAEAKSGKKLRVLRTDCGGEFTSGSSLRTTWIRLVDPPPRCHPISLKWVYKVKRDKLGAIVKHKARLVTRGFVQRKGINFEEVFAPVARIESVRLLLALAAAKDWRVHHLDVKLAFVNGELAEKVFVRQPPGEKGKEELMLGQRAYASKLLERSGMAECKPCVTPMEERLKLTKASTAAKVDATLYRSIVGDLCYLVYTRPDIAFAMGYVSRFMEDPREDHWAAVKRLLRYIKGTVD
ncbi:uncharacterized protein [Miscanthus floridulus]|uniref:uncharacterized protein n=1 Tax=Miscanthus floridulus TaxID=154761 RepID=UPI00345A5B2B